MTDEKPVEKEVVTQLDELKDVSYRKEYVAFVLKPLHISQCERWARWCSDRGLQKQHHKAFALAMDILEGKTQDLINSSSNFELLQRLVNTHDTLIEGILRKLGESENKEEENPNKTAIDTVRKRKEMREKAKEKELKNKKEGVS